VSQLHNSHPTNREAGRDKRLSLAPLTTEEALRGLMQAGPHPKEEKAGKKPAAPKMRRARKSGQPPKN
jgi:hypothetical protein